MNNIFLVQSCLNPDLKRGPLLQKRVSVCQIIYKILGWVTFLCDYSKTVFALMTLKSSTQRVDNI